MSARTTVEGLVERNKAYAANHVPHPFLSESTSLPTMLILTCVDPRCVPEQFLNLQAREALVVRNAAGHIGPNLNDILAVDRLMNFPEMMIIHHTDCGTTHYKDSEVREFLKSRSPADAKAIDDMAFGEVTDLEQSVRDDLALLKASPLVRKELAENAKGFVYDIKTGLLNPVVA